LLFAAYRLRTGARRAALSVVVAIWSAVLREVVAGTVMFR
jgi:hypothetical protein